MIPLLRFLSPLGPLLLGVLLLGAGISAFIYLSICLYLFLRQTRFIFFPTRQINLTPPLLNLDYEDVWIPIPKSFGRSDRLHAWWLPVPASQGTLLYLHGNSSNASGNLIHASRFRQLGLSVLLVDYRGYGQSQGSFPSEAQVYKDAELSWRHLTQNRQIPSEEIIVYGHSLGGAVAIELMMRFPQAAGLIVEGSFTSIYEMVQLRGQSLQRFPVRLLLHQRFDSIQKVRSLRVPVLFIHGVADEIVPFEMGEELYQAAAQPKYFYGVPAAGHNNLAEVAGAQYLQEIQEFVYTCLPPD